MSRAWEGPGEELKAAGSVIVVLVINVVLTTCLIILITTLCLVVVGHVMVREWQLISELACEEGGQTGVVARAVSILGERLVWRRWGA